MVKLLALNCKERTIIVLQGQTPVWWFEVIIEGSKGKLEESVSFLPADEKGGICG